MDNTLITSNHNFEDKFVEDFIGGKIYIEKYQNHAKDLVSKRLIVNSTFSSYCTLLINNLGFIKQGNLLVKTFEKDDYLILLLKSRCLEAYNKANAVAEEKYIQTLKVKEKVNKEINHYIVLEKKINVQTIKASISKPKINDQPLLKKAGRSYLCQYPECSKSKEIFRSKAKLKEHVKEYQHNKEGKPYPCLLPNCNYVASQLVTLRAHQQAHNKVRPYKCDFEDCTYKATQRSNLEKHQQAHEGIKPYECNFEGCFYKATQHNNLQRHKKAKHNIKTAI